MNRVGHHQSSRFEYVHRVEAVQQLMARGYSPVQIKAIAVEKWGVNASQAHRYLQRAREWQLRLVRSPLDYHRANEVKFYDTVISDPKTTIANKLTAWKQKSDAVMTPGLKFEVNHTGRVEIGASVGELIAAMSKDVKLRDEVLRLDRGIKLIERAEGSDTNGGTAVHSGTNGTSSQGGNGTNGTHEALPDA